MLSMCLQTALLFLLSAAAVGAFIFTLLCGRLQRRLDREWEREREQKEESDRAG